ncbi:Pantothenate transporter liz1 [Lecanosticta acicola]|uniref:Pantothenate transporter liz1 n=1 Tax=Lecanosticta acicola TaxID=111012 RepID=A0AAI8Z803_9PEZI|nr:Pantothenate transporter liz1 [Lecanosticta acicola]
MATVNKATEHTVGLTTVTPIPPPETEETDFAPQDKIPAWRKFLGLFWDSFSGPPRERRYIRTLDTYMFSYMCLAYFIKQLDQTNISNAFVSGMLEHLSLHGNERNWLNTYFNIGIMLGTLPAQMIQIQLIRPSLWIPCCEIVWSVLVIGMAFAQDVTTLYTLRFLVGFAEACVFPSFSALLGGWYGAMQLNKRMALFEQTSAIGDMFSGYLQAALYTGLDGHSGLQGWQWMFIVDGLIGIPIALWGFFAIPDLPHTTRAFYLSQEDKRYGVDRAERHGHYESEKLSLKGVVRVFLNWRLWLWLLPYVMVGQASSGLKYFNLWLKSEGYSVVEINIIPTAGSALSIVSSLAVGILVDNLGCPATTIVAIQILVMAANMTLSIWYVPKAAIMSANYLLYVGYAAQPINIAWGHRLTASDPHLRQLLVASGNVISYSFNAFIPLSLFPTYDAPHYDYGYQVMTLFSGLAILGTILMYRLQDRFPRG